MKTRLDVKSEVFQKNKEAMLEGVKRLHAQLERASSGGGEKAVERHRQKGKLLPRERVEKLLDEGAYFLEIAALAGGDSASEPPGGSVVGGIGLVSGVECLVVANESTVKAGALTETTLLKLARLAQIAEQNRLPTVYLVESAGADLPQQSKVFVPGGREFRDITRRSKLKAPTVSVVFGTATAGGAYIPGMSDYVIMVKQQARVFLAGPPLVKMATGEICDDESLGGAEMHSRKSGVSDFLAEDELDGIRLAREIVGHLNWRKPHYPLAPVKEPRHVAEELLGIPSASPRIPFDIREIIIRLADDSDVLEFKPLWGTNLVTGFGRVHGYPVGFLANNGVLDSESSDKGAQFIQLCNQKDTPLIFLQNITGFMVGKAVEEEGIIRHGAKLINAVANSTVPAITLMIGSSYGAGNYAMSGRAFEPRFLFTWPSHRIGVMGPKQLAGVMEMIRGEAAEKEKIEERMNQETDPFFATARLWDDGIIDPRDTRSVLGICLSAAANREIKGTMEWGVFRH